MSSKIKRISSRNHKVDITCTNSSATIVLKRSERKKLGKDFVLYLRDEKTNELVGLTALNEYHEQAVLITIIPDLRAPLIIDSFLNAINNRSKGTYDGDSQTKYETVLKVEEEEVKGGYEPQDDFAEPKLYEYIFLIDRSGSMHGKSMKLAIEALKVFVHSLPLGSKFNIFSFGTLYTKVFNESQIYTDESFKKAMEEISQFSANMGGTEILTPIQDIFQKQVDPKLPRHLYLLTDGAVANTKEIVSEIKKNVKYCRVHTFGIGEGASSELIKNCAFAGHGHYSFISDPEELVKKVMLALQKDFLEYLEIKEASFLDADEQVIKSF